MPRSEWPGHQLWERRVGTESAQSGLRSVAGESAVCDSVRTGRVFAESFDLVLLIGFEVAFEPVPVRRVLLCALPGEDVRGHAVEEPTVVRDDHGTAGEFEQSVL